jgi:hypothetical protein
MDRVVASDAAGRGLSQDVVAAERVVDTAGNVLKGKINATAPDLAVVIRGALPFINTNGSERAIDMLRAALVAHANAKPDEDNE